MGEGKEADGDKKERKTPPARGNAWFSRGPLGNGAHAPGGAAGKGKGTAPPPGMEIPAAAAATASNAPDTGDVPASAETSTAAAALANATTTSLTAVHRDRFLHLTLHLVGQRVEIKRSDTGAVLEGIFHTFTPFASQPAERKNMYVLRAARVVKRAGDGGDFAEGSTILIPADKVLYVHAKSVRLEGMSPTGTTAAATGGAGSATGTPRESFRTDTDISRSGGGGARDLVAAGSAWTQAPPPQAAGASRGASGSSGTSKGDAGALDGGLEDEGNKGNWDQFQANEKLFNVRASYDENLYTTELDKSNMDRSKMREAARIAKEIEGQATTNIHLAEERGQKVETDFLDEEDRYSGVLTSGGKVRAALESARGKTESQPALAGGGKGSAAGPATSSTTKPLAASSSAKPKMNFAAAVAAKSGNNSSTSAAPTKQAPAVKEKAESVATELEERNEFGTRNGSDNAVDSSALSVDVAPASEKIKGVSPKEDPTKKDSTRDCKEESEEMSERSAEKKGGESADTSKEKDHSGGSKLNASAKEFTFNPGAKTFTPGGGGGGGAGGVGAGGPTHMAHMGAGMPMPPGQHVYMQHPQGLMPMVNPHYAMQMRYQGGGYGGAMSHPGQMPHHMQVPPVPSQQAQPQAQQQQQLQDDGSAGTSGDQDEAQKNLDEHTGDANAQSQPQQQHQHAPVPYPGAPPGAAFYGQNMMPQQPRGPQPPPMGAYPPQMVVPGAGPYQPYMQQQMHGPGPGRHYGVAPMGGGMPYPQGGRGGSGPVEDDGRGGGRGGRSGSGRGRGHMNKNKRNGGRGGGGRGGPYNQHGHQAQGQHAKQNGPVPQGSEDSAKDAANNGGQDAQTEI